MIGVLDGYIQFHLCHCFSDIHFLLRVASIKLQCTFVFCKTHDGRWMGRFLKITITGGG
jgi:hypothetical protein